MDLQPVTNKFQYNKFITHVIQSWEWGEFRKTLGIKVLRYRAFQLTFHKIPFINQYVGYLPKGPEPDQELAEALKKIGQEQNCAFIKVEPDVIARPRSDEAILSRSPRFARDDEFVNKQFHPSPKPLFTKYNFIIDLTKSEEELLKNMHSKTRYNIRVAEKHGVKVEERTDDEALEIYLKLYFETTKRQGYHGHNENYHRQVWQILRDANMARLLIAFYNEEPLTAWMLLNFKDTLYYPYGGSAKSHPEVMANNLVAWEAIKLGKKLGLKKFDLWGADFKHGFHKFKQGYGGELVEYIGTFDLILNWPIYLTFTTIDKLTPLKISLLKLLKK